MTSPGLLNRKTIILVIRDQPIRLPKSRQVIVGRFAPTDNTPPDIDLVPYEAERKGVSRRHIRIVDSGNQVLVNDLDSLNGTWLNGERLKPLVEYPLHDGDFLKLGDLELQVKFGTTSLKGQLVMPSNNG